MLQYKYLNYFLKQAPSCALFYSTLYVQVRRSRVGEGGARNPPPPPLSWCLSQCNNKDFIIFIPQRMFSSDVKSLRFLSFLPSLMAPVSAYPGPVGSLKVMDFVGHPCLRVYVPMNV